jgi:DNA ligase (NAD+)
MNISNLINQDPTFYPNWNKEAANELKRLSELYYAGDPEVSDPEFDKLYQKLKEIDPLNPYFEKVNPQLNSGKIKRHLVPMLSIETEVDYSFQGLKNFDRRVKEYLSTTEAIEYIMELKYDGLGLNLYYEQGHLKYATVRGDGEKGEDVTHCLPLFGKDIPTFIPGVTTNFEIRGEAMMTQEEFLRINDVLESEGKKRLANARNAVAGTVRTLDLSKVEGRSLVFFPYCFGGGEPPSHLKSQSEVLLWFKDYFTFPKNRWITHKTATWDLGYLYSIFEAIAKFRNELGFAIDGIVYKVNDFELQKKLGFRSTTPKWAVAQKYPPETNETELLDIDIQIGRTGKVTPVARVAPVYVGGTTITNITLHNVFDIRRRGIRIGDTITVQRAGDVIPEIAYRSTLEPRKTYLDNFKMPSFCPCCDAPLKRPKGEADYYCINLFCPERILGGLVHFVSRQCMDIKGLGEETLRNLVESNKVYKWFDLYRLTEAELVNDGKMAPSNASKVMLEIEKSKKVEFHRFIHGLGIPNVGAGTSKRIAAVVKPHELSFCTNKLEGVPDIGEITINSIRAYFGFERNAPDYLFFIHSVPGVDLKLPEEKGTKLSGKVILFTGSFDTLKRDDLKTLVENNGGKVSSAVTNNTSLVVAGKSATKHKIEKALSLNIEVITEKDFLNLLK